jgi:hypothetical protein
MPKKGRIFPGVTRQVVIADDTHELLATVAQQENKYIGELADELLRSALARRARATNGSASLRHRPQNTAVR